MRIPCARLGLASLLLLLVACPSTDNGGGTGGSRDASGGSFVGVGGTLGGGGMAGSGGKLGSGGSDGGSSDSQAGGSSDAGGGATDGASQAIDADAYTALQIVQAQVLSGGDCAVPSAPTSKYRSSGTLDLALPDDSAPAYFLPVAIANNLDSSGATPATEMNNVALTYFTVELSAPDVEWQSACPATFDTPEVAVLVAPRATAGVSLNAITPSHARCLLPYVTAGPLTVTARISAKGRHGGTIVASPPFVYPIKVCAGCLQQGYSDLALKPYQYPAAPPLCSALSGVNPYTGDPCAPPGQDAQILCCALSITTGGVPKDVASCPGVFSGTTSTDAAASGGH